jgi:uncharacterized protein
VSTRLEDDLLRPEAYPEPRPARVELMQTHISWVFLLEREVFKVKRPVSLGFLNFATLDARKDACEAEVRLNERLARGVYLGVVPVVREADGRHRVGGEGPIVDWAVHMKRLPDARRADRLLSSGRLTTAFIDTVATRLAAFHGASGVDDEKVRFGNADAVAANVEENFAETAQTMGRYVNPWEAEEGRAWQRAFLRDHAPLFEQRIAAGRVRDGHGDLRLEHVYLADDGSPTIIDCIEFSERFRHADVCADVSFLSMDLAAHRRVDLAERLLARYARESNDFDLYALVDFYESYRAYVRAKVSSLVADDPTIDVAARERAGKDARAHFLLSLSRGRHALLQPAVVAVGGNLASGKTTIADVIGRQLSAPVVEADRTRKALLGVRAEKAVHEAPWSGAYRPDITKRVYGEIFRRAAVVLASGRPVIIDASFRSASFRKAARQLALGNGVPFRFVECRVDRSLARARLEDRALTKSVSDGRLAIFDAFSARFERVTELAASEHVVLDTERPLEESIAVLQDRLIGWPAGLAG